MQRKHITTACQVCRESKSKCDGVRPICGSCARKSKNCEYSAKDDKRKLSLRTAIEVLFGRVAQLSELANHYKLEIPPLGLDDQTLLEQVRANLDLPSDKYIFTPSTQYQPDHLDQTVPASKHQADLVMMPVQGANLTCTNPSYGSDPIPGFDIPNWSELTPQSWEGSPSDWPWLVLNDFSTFPAFPASSASPTFRSGYVPQNDGPGTCDSSGDEGEEGIIPSLAARFGSLQRSPNGRIRYYGTASNHHFLKNSVPHKNSFQIQDTQQDAISAALESAQLDQEVPLPLEKHLIELFFAWHNPCHWTVDRSIFETARKNNSDDQSNFCSQSLIATICAIGSAFEGRYHQSFITFPKPLSEFFADKSKILLDFELDSPCVATVQALLLLSSHEAACGRETRMWLYSGTALRLAFDLGLHVDSETYVKQGLFSVGEQRARQSTFWSCVVINHLWSFNLGLPFRLEGEEITVATPSTTNTGPETVQDTWTAYTEATSSNPTSNLEDRHMSGDSPCFVEWVSLCTELAPLFRVLYGCIKISKTSLQSLSYKTTTQFLNWRENIPSSLKITHDAVPLPDIILLHMAYYSFCILIHRPWTSKGSQPGRKIGPGYEHARRVCHTAASEIASLLRLYESHYGFRRMNVYVINIIVSASLILIFGLIAREVLGDESIHPEKPNVASDLNICFRALDELGQSFESARRQHEHLLAIQKHWSHARNPKLGAKRRSQVSEAFSKKSRVL